MRWTYASGCSMMGSQDVRITDMDGRSIDPALLQRITTDGEVGGAG
jgi:hypothetical protein